MHRRASYAFVNNYIIFIGQQGPDIFSDHKSDGNACNRVDSYTNIEDEKTVRVYFTLLSHLVVTAVSFE